METLVVMVVAVWAIRRLIVDASFALRGRVPPTMTGRQGGGRYGLRCYLGDVWSDAWRSAADRRLARRAARDERRTAGQPGRLRALRQRLGGWWQSAGGSRHLHRRPDGVLVDTITSPRATRWDRAWDRAAQRRAARRGAAEPDRPDSRQPRPGRQRWAEQDRRQDRPAAAGAPPPAAGSTYRSGDAGREPAAAAPAGDRSGGIEPGPAPGGPPGAGPDGGHHSGAAVSASAPGRHDNRNHKEGNPMAEATGLTSSISYAGAQADAARGNVTEVEQWLASLEAHEVSGETIAAGRQAMEQYQAAAVSFERAKAALSRHLQVKEAYDANQDAGDREFVTSE